MSRIAFISDVHGNFDALSAVLDDAWAQVVDKFIFLGDYVFDMPDSGRVVDAVRGINGAEFISGNKEAFLATLSKQDKSQWTHEQLGVIYQTYRELSPENMDWLLALNKEKIITLDSGRRIFLTHHVDALRAGAKNPYNSSSKFEQEMRRAPFTHEEYLRGLENFYAREMADEFASIDADIIAYGHDHLQGWARCGGKLIIDAGSCGLPLDGDNRAAYTILDDAPDGLSVIERRVEYDIDGLIERMRHSSTYKAGASWSELIIMSLKSGFENLHFVWRIAREIAARKGEEGGLYTNETWRETCARFMAGERPGGTFGE